MQNLQNIDSGKIFSPKPNRIGIRLQDTTNQNPFQCEFGVPNKPLSDLSSLVHQEDQQVLEELNQILSPRKSCKSPCHVPSRHTAPSFRRNLTRELFSCDSAPPREKENPIISDEFFLELNSACSTADNSPLRTFSPKNCSIQQE